ncbi:hypothetical protein FHG87_003180 [Trinorchestia longiramus]|nr:hypothetical protein FHG87_003180 [Trinorchestia longiramus]
MEQLRPDATGLHTLSSSALKELLDWYRKFYYGLCPEGPAIVTTALLKEEGGRSRELWSREVEDATGVVYREVGSAAGVVCREVDAAAGVVCREQSVMKWIVPSTLRRHDLLELPSLAAIFAELVMYVPDETRLNPVHASVQEVLQCQKGGAFELATCLCSLVQGAGYNAYVVHGEALGDLVGAHTEVLPCPYIPPHEQASDFHPNIVQKAAPIRRSSRSLKYAVRKPPVLRSSFIRRDCQQNTDVCADGAESSEPSGKDASKLSVRPYLPHYWVLVLPPNKDVTQPVFVEPSTGELFLISLKHSHSAHAKSGRESKNDFGVEQKFKPASFEPVSGEENKANPQENFEDIDNSGLKNEAVDEFLGEDNIKNVKIGAGDPNYQDRDAEHASDDQTDQKEGKVQDSEDSLKVADQKQQKIQEDIHDPHLMEVSYDDQSKPSQFVRKSQNLADPFRELYSKREIPYNNVYAIFNHSDYWATLKPGIPCQLLNWDLASIRDWFSFLASVQSRFGARVEVLPTAVPCDVTHTVLQLRYPNGRRRTVYRDAVVHHLAPLVHRDGATLRVWSKDSDKDWHHWEKFNNRQDSLVLRIVRKSGIVEEHFNRCRSDCLTGV